MDPYDFLEATEVAARVPANFYQQMESKKWSDRKEALDEIDKITSVPKIQNSDFNELVRILRKTVAKDSNIVVATLAAKCLSQLAQGLRTNFSPHSDSCLVVYFDKFKEKKSNVIAVLRDATDAAFVSSNLERVLEDVTLFLDNKNPQIKSEVALFLARIFSRYPDQVMNKKTLRPLMNALVKTLNDMDATVRDSSATAIGTAMKVAGEKLILTIIEVEPIKLTKIKEAYDKAEIIAPQQAVTNGETLDTAHVLNTTTVQVDGPDDPDDDQEDRLYEMLDPIDVLPQIPSSFYTQMESKKWSDRKEALDEIEKITSAPKIQNSDFNELVRILRKTVGKDSNIVVATLAAKCLCQLSQGLRVNFSPHSNACLSVYFDKFKEKKPNVVSVLRDATDAAFIGTNLESMLEDITLFLDNKNPQIKSEMALFLSRVFAKYPVQVMNKKTLRPLMNALAKTLNDMDATVRENSAMAIGTAMKVTGETLMMSIIGDVDPIKLTKVKEFCDKAQVKKIPKSALSAMSGPEPQAAPAPAPVRAQVTRPALHAPKSSALSSATMIRSTSAKRAPPKPSPVVRNASATVKRNATIVKKSASSRRLSDLPKAPQPPVYSTLKQPETSMRKPTELIRNNLTEPSKQANIRQMLPRRADPIVDDMLDFVASIDIQIPANFYQQMESKKWSDRKEALEEVEKVTAVQKIRKSDYSELVRVLKKTVAKDSNIVVATLAAKCLCQLSQGLRTGFSQHSLSCLTVYFDKFKEKKPNVISVLRDAADAAFVGTDLESMIEDVTLFLDNKNPQIKSEMALFLARVFSRYPDQVMNKKTLRTLMNALVKTLNDMDATVRESAATAIGTAMKVAGEKLILTIIEVEPIKLVKIKEAYEKAEIITPQQELVGDPSCNGAAQTINLNSGQVDGAEDFDPEDEDDRLYDMLDSIDIASQIPSSFYTQMESKKWSDRKEALDEIEKITSAPKIQNSDLNELVRVLRKTVAKDSNIVVATLAAKCLCQISQGTRAGFSMHSNACLEVYFEKFKEKKPNVICVLRDAADAAFVGTNLESMLEDITLFLDNKNPQIKSEMALFLSRVFAKYPVQVMNKKTLRPLMNALAKTLNDMDATVRESSANAIGTAMKVTGETLMMSIIGDVDPIKLTKIKEFCDKAQVKKLTRSALVAMNTNPAEAGQSASAAAPATSTVLPARSALPAPKSSATMIRSTSAKRIPPSIAPKPSPALRQPSSATVKRTATIVKKSGAASKTPSGLPQPRVYVK